MTYSQCCRNSAPFPSLPCFAGKPSAYLFPFPSPSSFTQNHSVPAYPFRTNDFPMTTPSLITAAALSLFTKPPKPPSSLLCASPSPAIQIWRDYETRNGSYNTLCFTTTFSILGPYASPSCITKHFVLLPLFISVGVCKHPSIDC